jgi:hypothetical protein
MTLMNFPLPVSDHIDELTAAGSLLRERLAGKPQTPVHDPGSGLHPHPQPPDFATPHSAGARPKGMGARYSQSAVALLLYR